MEQLEIYIHIPFCLAKCGYCDFLSFPASGEMQKQYMEALVQEISGFPEARDRQVTSVFFGGGTPTALPAEALTEILSVLRQNFLSRWMRKLLWNAIRKPQILPNWRRCGRRG